MKNYRLLIVDDDVGIGKILTDLGKKQHYQVLCATTANDFRKQLPKFDPTLIILDLNLAGSDSDAVELLRYLANENYQNPVVLIGSYDSKVLDTAMQLGKSHGLHMLNSLPKPFKIAAVAEVLEQAKSLPAQISIEKIITAIKAEEFTLHYQPKISLKNNQVVGVEALARWQDKNNSTIATPNVFIPFAEKNELIKPLTTLIVKKAFAQAAKWQKKGLKLNMAINLSGNSLWDLPLPDELAKAAAKYHVQPENITFELTETAVINQPDVAMDILLRLRLKGFLLSIDDFGVEYASLVQIYHMPFNEIKIDRSFISNLTENNEEAQSAVYSMLDLCKHLQMTSVAEGVESKTAWDFLVKAGCDVAQGYLISRPLSAKDFESWLKQHTDAQLKFKFN